MINKNETVSNVFAIDYHSSYTKNIFKKIKKLLFEAGLSDAVKEGDIVAIKTHFGEEGNTGFISPLYIRHVVDIIRELGANPFVTDTNTLYKGERTNAVDHLMLAYKHGFSPVTINAPVVIADGLRGHNGVKVDINGKHYDSVKVAEAIYEADSMITLSHFKGHEVFGFGGTLKNIAMGCSIREGKMSMHSTVAPFVKEKKCTGCEICITVCPENTIKIINNKAVIKPEGCIGCADCIAVCPEHAIRINWNAEPSVIQEKLIEHVEGVLSNKRDKSLFVNFIKDVTPLCDCVNHSDIPFVNDIGILASRDPLAIDKASVDLVNNAQWRNDANIPPIKIDNDKFSSLYPDINWRIQIDYAVQREIGSVNYNLIKLFKAKFSL